MSELEIVDGVAWLRLRDGKANAIDAALLERLDRFARALADSEARAAVIAGEGRAFSAGLALPTLIDLDRATMKHFIGRFGEVMSRLFTLPQPVVAAVNGHAIAGGCVLALQADWRVMAEGEARIGLNESQLGIGLPSVVMETLRAQVPPSSLVPLAVEGRLMSPREAHELGLVDEVVAPEALLARAGDVARSWAALPPEGVRQIKAALRRPVLEQVRQFDAVEREAWLDTWFSPGAQARLRATVARLAKKT